MGTVIHKTAIITGYVSSFDLLHESNLSKAHAYAHDVFPNMVSDMIPHPVNGDYTFMIVSSGSKLGWADSAEHDRKLGEFVDCTSSLGLEVLIVEHGETSASVSEPHFDCTYGAQSAYYADDAVESAVKSVCSEGEQNVNTEPTYIPLMITADIWVSPYGDLIASDYSCTEKLVSALKAGDVYTVQGEVINPIVQRAVKTFDHAAPSSKISGVKLIRNITNCGLKEAKDAYESIVDS